MITEGVVAFSNLSETEKYNGQDTGKFSIVLTLEEDEAGKLSDAGVHATVKALVVASIMLLRHNGKHWM